MLGPFILRVVLGLIFIDLGILKFRAEKQRWMTSFETLGLRPADVLVSFYGLLQIIGGLMLLVGFYTQIAALATYIRNSWGNGFGEVTTEEVAAPSLGYTFPVNEENMRRWRGWWKVANREHFITFFLIGAITLVMLSVLVWSTVGRANVTGSADIEVITEEARILGNQIGGWFRAFFLFAGMVVLFSTSIGIMDYVSRLSASELKVSFFPNSQTITESRIYFTFAWIIAIAGSLILLAGLEAPLVLLIISASGGGVVMFLYSGMLLWMNTRVLPDAIKLKGWRLVAMWIIFLIFAVLSIYLVYYQIASNFFGVE
jgi:hypothetical protein